ncbi:hypothetical protein L3Y34_011591 [Caenorhabditis briggsae]|uniref:Cytosolic fatty-acid binding proteins domain-containing protein n=1 Tax=Caenorhabditis briggsae TaxID=6238 RepID=A0AAE8ZRN8_CAEBR|nr:hypothetical protein L3Y34_011591 [Caenorhabditis briggsae]
MHISSIILLSAFATAFFCSKECAAKPAAVAVAAAASAAASAAAVAAAAVAAATNNHRRANYQKSPASRYRSPRGIPDVLPEQFFGTFDLDHSENFDEYLTAKRYGWFTRKLVIFATFRKVFTRTDSKTLFDFSNLTSKKDVHYKNIELGKAFQGEGLDRGCQGRDLRILVRRRFPSRAHEFQRSRGTQILQETPINFGYCDYM